MGHQRDAPVNGDDQPQANQSQIAAFLLGVAPLGDRGPVVGTVDVGGEVGHVQHQARQVDLEGVHHRGPDPPFDLSQLGLVDPAHRIPEPPVVQRGRGQLDDPVARRGRPPVGKRPLGARVNDPVCGGQRDVGPDRTRGVGPTRTHDLINDLRDLETLQHRPHGREVAKTEVARAVGLARSRLRQAGNDRLGGTEIALGDDAGLSLYPG